MKLSANNYYVRSIFTAGAVLAGAGCAGAALGAGAATRVRFSSVARLSPAERSARFKAPSLIIEFDPGDRVPLDWSIESKLAEQEPAPAHLELLVRRRFFLLVRRGEPPRLSLDGKDFSARDHGWVKFGMRSDRSGARFALSVGVWPPASNAAK